MWNLISPVVSMIVTTCQKAAVRTTCFLIQSGSLWNYLSYTYLLLKVFYLLKMFLHLKRMFLVFVTTVWVCDTSKLLVSIKHCEILFCGVKYNKHTQTNIDRTKKQCFLFVKPKIIMILGMNWACQNMKWLLCLWVVNIAEGVAGCNVDTLTHSVKILVIYLEFLQ